MDLEQDIEDIGGLATVTRQRCQPAPSRGIGGLVQGYAIEPAAQVFDGRERLWGLGNGPCHHGESGRFEQVSDDGAVLRAELNLTESGVE